MKIFWIGLWIIVCIQVYSNVPMITQFIYAPAEIKNAQIYDIIEFDKEIYFATSKTFFKYNGKDIYTFSDSDSLITMDIFNFQIHDDKLWFNDLLGRLYYIPRKQTKIHLYKPLSDVKIKCFYWYKNVLYYTNINGKTWLYNKNTGLKKNLSEKTPNNLAFQQIDKYLYILHSEFTYSQIDIETQSFYNVKSPEYNSSTPIRNKSNWHPINQLYSFDKNIIALLNVQKNTTTTLASLPKEQIIYAIYPIDSLKMLIGTQKGLYWVEQGKINSMQLQKFITNIFKDSEDRFWITTFNGDIFLIHNIEVRTHEPANTPVLKNEMILSKIAMYEGKPIYGSQTGQVWFNHQLITDIKLNYEKGRLNRVLDIQVKDKKVYIVRDDGIYIYQPDTRTTEYISNLPSIKKLLLQKSDVAIVGVYLGLFSIDLRQKKILKKHNSPRMVDIVLWKNMPFVIGYHQLFLFDKDTLKEVLNDKYSFNRIYFAYSDTSYKVLYIVHQKGIDVYNENWSLLYNIPIYQNEPTKIIAYQKYLYIATQKGLFVLSREPNSKNQLQIEYNTQNLCIHDISISQDSLHFVSDMGYGYIPIPKLNTKNNQIAVHTYCVKRDTIIPVHEKIYLRYPDNILKLSLFPATIRYQSVLRYEYQVKTDDNNHIVWTEKTNLSKVNIPFFHTGEYQIIIYTYANDVLINQQTFELQYVLPIWKEKSFKVLLSIVFVLLVVIFYIYQSVQKEKRKNTEKKLKIENLQYQLNAMQSKLNPHFIFNAMQSLQYLITSHQNDIARKYLNNFSQLLRRFLDFSCQEFTSIEEEIEILEKYLTIENIAREQKVNYKYCVNIEDPNIISEKFIPALILQPIVENTFKHAFPEYHPDPQLIIRFTDNPEKHQFYIEIEDNGVGMPNKINANSKGMQLIMQRLEILNQKGIHKYELSISNSQSYHQGTLICLTVTF